MTINNKFNIKEIVYVIHDMEQLPRMIVEIRVSHYGIIYELQSGTVVSSHYDYEMSRQKTIY